MNEKFNRDGDHKKSEIVKLKNSLNEIKNTIESSIAELKKEYLSLKTNVLK